MLRCRLRRRSAGRALRRARLFFSEDAREIFDAPGSAALVQEIVEDQRGSRQWYLAQLDEVIAIVTSLDAPVALRSFRSGEPVGAERDRALHRLTVEHFRARGVHDVLWDTGQDCVYPAVEYD